MRKERVKEEGRGGGGRKSEKLIFKIWKKKEVRGEGEGRGE